MDLSRLFLDSARSPQPQSIDELRQYVRENLPVLEGLIGDPKLKSAILKGYQEWASVWAEDMLIDVAFIDFAGLEKFLKGVSQEKIEDAVRSFLPSAGKALLTSALEEETPASTEKQAEILTLIKDMMPDRSWAVIADILNLGESSIGQALERGDYYLQRLDRADLERLEKAMVEEFPVNVVAGGIFKIFQTVSAKKLDDYFKLFSQVYTKKDARTLLNRASPAAIDLARAFAEGTDLMPQTRTLDFQAFSHTVKFFMTVAQEIVPIAGLLPALQEETKAVKAYVRKMDGLIADMVRQKPRVGVADPAPQ